LKVGIAGPGAGVYHNDSLTAVNFSGAVTAADTQIQTTHAADKYAAVQVGADVVVFIDTNADHHITTADDAIILAGRSLTDLIAGGGSFI
jgi:hypothetical protein